jgi:hypothetical protein
MMKNLSLTEAEVELLQDAVEFYTDYVETHLSWLEQYEPESYNDIIKFTEQLEDLPSIMRTLDKTWLQGDV